MSSAKPHKNNVLEAAGANNPSSVVTIFVCTSCGLSEDAEDLNSSDGMRLHAGLEKLAALHSNISIQPVDCLAVCDQSVTIAFSAAQKWTYVIGGVEAIRDQDDILSVAQSIWASESGVPALIDRPPFFRKGVISRLPPVPLPHTEG